MNHVSRLLCVTWQESACTRQFPIVVTPLFSEWRTSAIRKPLLWHYADIWHITFASWKRVLFFLKKKSHLSKALGPGARPSLAKQWLVSQPRAHAPLPLHAATEPYSSSQQTASTYGWLCHTCFLPQCSAVGKGLLIKNQGSSSGIREADLNLAPLPVKLWCEGPGASGLPFQIDSIC